MTLSFDTSSPSHINKESPLLMENSELALISPCSDKRFWSTLHNRVELLLESRKLSQLPSSGSIPIDGESSRMKRMKEDSMLLIKGFDSIKSSLSQLTNNLDNALQGTRDLAKSTALTEIVHSTGCNAKQSKEEENEGSEKEDDGEEEKKGVKRKLDECSSDQGGKEKEEVHQAEKNLKKVKNLAVSMAKKSASLAKELKSVKSDMCFLQERCVLLEEENQRLRDGFDKGIRPEEDDLVRLQLEALLAEKSRLANENANLTRENQNLRQLVEYHQFASEDLSASYEEVIQGLCLDFSSPGDEDRKNDSAGDHEDPLMPRTLDIEFHSPLHKNLVGEEVQGGHLTPRTVDFEFNSPPRKNLAGEEDLVNL